MAPRLSSECLKIAGRFNDISSSHGMDPQGQAVVTAIGVTGVRTGSRQAAHSQVSMGMIIIMITYRGGTMSHLSCWRHTMQFLWLLLGCICTSQSIIRPLKKSWEWGHQYLVFIFVFIILIKVTFNYIGFCKCRLLN